MVSTYSFSLRNFVDSVTGSEVATDRRSAEQTGPSPARPSSTCAVPSDRYFGDDQNPLLANWCHEQLTGDATIWPLVLCGPSGVGKTRVAETLLCRLQDGGFQCWKTTGADFRRHFLAAVSTKSSLAFRQPLCDWGAILIDDLGAACDQSGVQRELVRLIDEFAGRRPLLVTMRRNPLADGALSRPLQSRLAQGLVIEVKPAGPAARRQLIRAVAQRLELSLDQSLENWCVNHLPVAPSSIQQSLSRVALHAQTAGAISSVRQLCDLLMLPMPEDDAERVRQITSVAAAHCGLSAKQLRGPLRRKNIVHARGLAMYLVRHSLKLSYASIGQYFGGRDSSTVRHACQRVTRWLETDSTHHRLLREMIDSIGPDYDREMVEERQSGEHSKP